KTKETIWILGIALPSVIVLLSGLYGVDQKKPNFIVPLIVVSIIFIGLVIIATFTMIVYLIMQNDKARFSIRHILVSVFSPLFFGFALACVGGYLMEHTLTARSIVIQEKAGRKQKYEAVHTPSHIPIFTEISQ
ncbi:hypothetical protein PMAYCL1PPCAC_04225, partial [Pristionchus mayeri]